MIVIFVFICIFFYFFFFLEFFNRLFFQNIKALFLAQPLQARLAFAAQARAASKARYGELQASGMSETITDVAPATVQEWFQRYGLRRMIHGHTHRPAIHDEGHGRTRIVLGDWYHQGSVLRVGADGASLVDA